MRGEGDMETRVRVDEGGGRFFEFLLILVSRVSLSGFTVSLACNGFWAIHAD